MKETKKIRKSRNPKSKDIIIHECRFISCNNILPNKINMKYCSQQCRDKGRLLVAKKKRRFNIKLEKCFVRSCDKKCRNPRSHVCCDAHQKMLNAQNKRDKYNNITIVKQEREVERKEAKK